MERCGTIRGSVLPRWALRSGFGLWAAVETRPLSSLTASQIPVDVAAWCFPPTYPLTASLRPSDDAFGYRREPSPPVQLLAGNQFGSWRLTARRRVAGPGPGLVFVSQDGAVQQVDGVVCVIDGDLHLNDPVVMVVAQCLAVVGSRRQGRAWANQRGSGP